MQPLVPVRDVAIRENFRQAMSLWQKVNQLGVELVGGGEPPPIVARPSDRDFGPPEVRLVLTSVQARLQEIRDGVEVVGAGGGIVQVLPPPLDVESTPSDVFRSLVQANRQVNRMLVRGVQPGDVYQQVIQAAFFASEILTTLGDAQPYPEVPEYESGLQPGHVYGRLLTVLDRLSAAFGTWGLSMLDWTGGAYTVDESLTPGDVYDLATLLLSELEYLHSQLPGVRAPLHALCIPDSGGRATCTSGPASCTVSPSGSWIARGRTPTCSRRRGRGSPKESPTGGYNRLILFLPATTA